MSSETKNETLQDPRIGTQSRTFLYWIAITTGNRVLKSDRLHEKLSDGVLLIKLLQSLAPPKKIRGRYDS